MRGCAGASAFSSWLEVAHEIATCCHVEACGRSSVGLRCELRRSGQPSWSLPELGERGRGKLQFAERNPRTRESREPAHGWRVPPWASRQTRTGSRDERVAERKRSPLSLSRRGRPG